MIGWMIGWMIGLIIGLVIGAASNGDVDALDGHLSTHSVFSIDRMPALPGRQGSR